MAPRASVAAENQRAVSIEIANGTGFTRPPLLRFLHDPLHRRPMPTRSPPSSPLSAARRTAIAPSGQDGLAALALAEAAVRSVAEGKKIKVADVLG